MEKVDIKIDHFNNHTDNSNNTNDSNNTHISDNTYYTSSFFNWISWSWVYKYIVLGQNIKLDDLDQVSFINFIKIIYIL